MKTVLIVGATRNLGKALLEHYSAQDNTIVYATARYGKPIHHKPNVHWMSGVDLSQENAGSMLMVQYGAHFPIDLVYVVATSSTSTFTPETLEHPNMDKELKMYRTTAIGPVLFMSKLAKSGALARDSKIVFIGGEAGRVTLPGADGAGGNFGYHGSQAALNAVVRIFAHELAPKNISVCVAFPGRFLREGESHHRNAVANGQSEDLVTAEVAARAVVSFAEESLDASKSGQVWATRGWRTVPGLKPASSEIRTDESPVELRW